MKTYSTSQELAGILFNNGFTETTSTYYPDKEGAKRSFNVKGRRFQIVFDYINIGVIIRSSYVFHGLSISDVQLRAVITYQKFSSVDKSTWRLNHGYNSILEISEVIERMNEGDHWYRSSFYKRLKATYEGLVL